MRALLILTVCVSLAAWTTSAATLSFKVVTDHVDCLYACGEEATFTVTALDEKGAPARAGALEATIDNFGNRRVAARTIDLAQENPFTLKVAKATPGFLRLQVSSRTKGLSVAPNKGQKDAFTWGVAYEPTKIRPGAARPEDFDAFWADAVRKLDETVPVDAQLVEVPAKSNDQRRRGTLGAVLRRRQLRRAHHMPRARPTAARRTRSAGRSIPSWRGMSRRGRSSCRTESSASRPRAAARSSSCGNGAGAGPMNST